MAFTYRQVKDLYDGLADSGAVTSSLPEWSEEMNRLTGTDLYSGGLEDNWIKRASVGLDRILEATGIPDLLGEAGGAVGGWFGNEEAGRAIGKGTLRGAINFLPMLIPGVGAGANALRLGGTGLATGVGTYTDTGSKAAGVLSGITAAAMPWAAGQGEQALLRALGGNRLAGRITTVPCRRLPPVAPRPFLHQTNPAWSCPLLRPLWELQPLA